MLPGFRFLFAAIALSVSVLVFGLGAAALLRAAHEQFVSDPAWRTPPEPAYAGADTRPVLAVLQVAPPSAGPGPVTDKPVAAAPAEPEAIVAAPAQTEPPGATTVEKTTPAGDPGPTLVAAAQNPPAAETAPAQPEVAEAKEHEASDVTAPAAAPQAAAPEPPPAPAPAEEPASAITVANTTAPAAPAANAAPVEPAPDPAPAPLAQSNPPAAPPPRTNSGGARVAALGHQPVAAAHKPATRVATLPPERTPEADAIKRRLAARQATERRRVAELRARTAQQAAVVPPFIMQPAIDPFAQQMINKPAATARTR